MTARYIAIDWGSTNLRAWLYQGDHCLESRQSEAGVTRLNGKSPAAVLAEVTTDWRGDHLRPFYFCNPQLSSRKSILFGSTRNALQVIIMGLFDEVVGAFLKGDAGKYQAILSWVEEQGGIQVLLEKLQSGGLGAILSTWLSNQQGNQSVSGEQLESALGTNAVSDLGQKLGVDTSTASSLLAEQLPKIIDALSPQGEVSPQANNDLLSAGMELLKGKLFR